MTDWPALMTDEHAAAYLDMSEASFRIIAARHKVKPVETGLRMTRWRRTDLDRLIDSLPLRGEVDRPPGDRAAEVADPARLVLAPDPVEAALARVQRRTKRAA